MKILIFCWSLMLCLPCLCFENIPVELVGVISAELDNKAYMRLLMTCKKFYAPCLGCLNPDDHTHAMIGYARDKDEKKFNDLMKNEGPINKRNRESIEKFFNNLEDTKQWSTIDIYGQVYAKSDLFPFSGCDIKVLAKNWIPVAQLIHKQGYDFNHGDSDGRTILHKFAMENDFDWAEVLLSDDYFLVDPNISDDDYLTPYDYVKDYRMKALLAQRSSFLSKHKMIRIPLIVFSGIATAVMIIGLPVGIAALSSA